MAAGKRINLEGKTRVVFAQQFADGTVYIGRSRSYERRMKQVLHRWAGDPPVASVLLQEGGDAGADVLNAWRFVARRVGLAVRREPNSCDEGVALFEYEPAGKEGERVKEIAARLIWPRIADTALPLDVPRRPKPLRSEEEPSLLSGLSVATSEPVVLQAPVAPPALEPRLAVPDAVSSEAVEAPAPPAVVGPVAPVARAKSAGFRATQLIALVSTKPRHAPFAYVDADDRAFVDLVATLRQSFRREPETRLERAALKLRQHGGRLDLVILGTSLFPVQAAVPQVRSWEVAARHAGVGIIDSHGFGHLGAFVHWPVDIFAPAVTRFEFPAEDGPVSAGAVPCDDAVVASTDRDEPPGAADEGAFAPEPQADDPGAGSVVEAVVGASSASEAEPLADGADDVAASGVPPTAVDAVSPAPEAEASGAGVPSARELVRLAHVSLRSALGGLVRRDPAEVASAMGLVVSLMAQPGDPCAEREGYFDVLERDALGREMILVAARGGPVERMVESLSARLSLNVDRDGGQAALLVRCERAESRLAAAVALLSAP